MIPTSSQVTALPVASRSCEKPLDAGLAYVSRQVPKPARNFIDKEV
jgi:hypothetical protein